MKNQKTILTTIILFTCSLFTTYSQTTILSGFKGGSYYEVAKEIKNHYSDSIEIYSSKGNYYNFNQLKKSKYDIVFLQYDVFYLSSLGYEDVKNIKNIRILLPLGKEEIHLVTLKENKINSLKELEKKKIGIGSINQGTNITASLIKQTCEINWKDVSISFEESFTALLDNKIDAFFFVGSAPVAEFNNLSPEIKNQIKLIPITDSKLEKIYKPAEISKNTYNWQEESIQTYSVRYALATNTTNETEKDRKAYKSILTNIKTNIIQFQEKGHQVWKQVDFDYSNINAEIHDVAKEIFSID